MFQTSSLLINMSHLIVIINTGGCYSMGIFGSVSILFPLSTTLVAALSWNWWKALHESTHNRDQEMTMYGKNYKFKQDTSGYTRQVSLRNMGFIIQGSLWQRSNLNVRIRNCYSVISQYNYALQHSQQINYCTWDGEQVNESVSHSAADLVKVPVDKPVGFLDLISNIDTSSY